MDGPCVEADRSTALELSRDPDWEGGEIWRFYDCNAWDRLSCILARLLVIEYSVDQPGYCLPK